MHNVPAAGPVDQDTPADTPPPLSHGARLTEQLIRRSRPLAGGAREVGQSRLARLLNRGTRQVRRYTAELEAHGRLTREAPRRAYREGKGWRSTSCTRYRLSTPGDSRITPGQPGRTYVSGRPPYGGPGVAKHRPPRGTAPAHPLQECTEPRCRAPFRAPEPRPCPSCSPVQPS